MTGYGPVGVLLFHQIVKRWDSRESNLLTFQTISFHFGKSEYILKDHKSKTDKFRGVHGPYFNSTINHDVK